MIFSAICCWLGTGLFVLAVPGRAKRVLPVALPAAMPALMRLGACGFVLWGFTRLVETAGLGLGCAELGLILMTALSAAVLFFALNARLYLASLAVAMLGAAAVCFRALG